MMDIRHPAGERVLARQHGQFRPALAHRFDGSFEAFTWQGAEGRIRHPAGEVRIGPGLALEGDHTSHADVF